MRREVAPQQINTAGDAATLLAVQNGDLHVHQRIGTHFIDELSYGAVAVAANELPSRLLNAGNRVVDFTGRRQELADLSAWRDGEAAMAVRLVHGGAGQGKTRLAHRFAELAHAGGWITVRARHSRDAVVQPVEVAAGTALVAQKPLLVLVDYAERWPLSDLLALLLDRRLHTGRALRVLLLARPLGTWWDALTHRLSETLGVHADSTELAPAQTGSPEVFEVARRCFARVLGIPVPAHPAPQVEGSFLTVHMAALAHVLAVRHGEEPPTDPAQLSAYLLSRERNHWQSMYDNDRRVESPPPVLGRAVYVAALIRSLDYASALPVLKAVAVVDGVSDAGRVLEDHAMCYPPHDPDTVLEPLYPDRLAEDFVALQTPGHDVEGFRADPWAKGALGALLAHDARSAATALPMLVEAARRWPHLATNQLVPVLRERPELAVRAGSAALSAIAGAPAMPLDVLAAIESAFPPEPPADLHAGIAAVTERLARELAGSTNDPVRVGALALKLGWRLVESGRIRDGIDLLAEAVAIARRLGVESGAAHAAQLEVALRSLGRACIRAGDWVRATDTLGEAVGLWNDSGTGMTPPAEDVAACLADLSLALWRQGRDTASLSTRHRAIAQLRRLVLIDGRHRLTLIRVLVQQAEQLRRADRLQGALAAVDEALALLQAMADSAGEGLEVDFAAVLLGRAKTLHSFGLLPEAAFAASSAVAVFQRLAGVNVYYDTDLAHAHQAHADVLAAQSQWRKALDAQAEALAIHRRLARTSAERHELDLIQTLIKFARLCRDAGMQSEPALRSLAEAIKRAHAPRFQKARDRIVQAACAIGADILDADGRHAEADAMRGRAGRPAEWPSRPSPPGTRPDRDEELRIAEWVVRVTPREARAYLEVLPVQEIAHVLVVIDPQVGWFDHMFLNFDPARQVAILRCIVRDDALPDNHGMTECLVRRFESADDEELVLILSEATPANGAAILDHVQKSGVRSATRRMAHARIRSTLRRLGPRLRP
ncbi:hypothetical protein [Paractinoplanes lichenicola]|uniref:ATP-binding protein n=1 Tax=Paractinoplanes lichenicola TaxID=2802976 RepID=A0ABS1VZ53_9ACTN|nr:hypothetical protein [Actinoplanes lichenicola]MBL7259774.1 hypothetical protein [Actinoplanes lichenicola]